MEEYVKELGGEFRAHLEHDISHLICPGGAEKRDKYRVSLFSRYHD